MPVVVLARWWGLVALEMSEISFFRGKLLRPYFLNEYILRLLQKCRYQVSRERNGNIGKEMLWVLFEGTKLPGGTVISDKGTCFNKTRTNKHFFIHRKTWFLMEWDSVRRIQYCFLKKPVGGHSLDWNCFPLLIDISLASAFSHEIFRRFSP